MKLHEIARDYTENKLELARKISAKYLGMKPVDMVTVSSELLDKVLDHGREVEHERIEVTGGDYFVRHFKFRGRSFAYIETPNKNFEMYSKPLNESELDDWEPEPEPTPTKSVKVRPVDGAKWPVSVKVGEMMDEAFGQNQWSMFPEPHNFTTDPITIFLTPKATVTSGMKLLRQHKIKPMFLEGAERPSEDNNFGFKPEWKPFWFKMAIDGVTPNIRAVEHLLKGVFADKDGGANPSWTLLKQGALKGNSPRDEPMVVMFNPKLTTVNLKKLRAAGFEPVFIR